MVHYFDSGLGAHRVQDELHGLGVEGGEMVVPGGDPGAERSAGADFAGVDGTPQGDHAVHYLFEDAADYHLFARGVIAGHERRHKAAGGHASKAVALLHDERPDSASGRGQRGADACGASAHHEYVRGAQVGAVGAASAG